MKKKDSVKRLTDEIRHNSELKDMLEYFCLSINTPEKSDLAVKCLRGISAGDEISKPVFVILVRVEEALDLTEESTREAQLREALADLCRYLGSPDNCRIALCAIHHALRGTFDLILERDAGPVAWYFMLAISRCVYKIIEALAAAKQATAEDKED